MNELLRIEDLGISFGSNQVLKSINFVLNENEVLGIIGPNGAGKTVLLNLITGILKPDKGKIIFNGEEINDLSIVERCRKGFGRTFQVPRPFEHMTVLENLMTAAINGNGLSEKQAKQRALDVLELIGVTDKVNLFAGKLGLLDRKRMEIGRALATNPKILLLDEVGGGLTESEVEDILDLVRLVKSQGVGVIWIEHIIKTMMEGTDRVLLVAGGVNVICDTPDCVMCSKEVKETYLGAEEL